MLVTSLVPEVMKSYRTSLDKVYVWWDYFCINQTDAEVRTLQLETIPAFVVASDVVVACRSGDDLFHHPDGPQIVRNGALEPYAGKLNEHPGHYNNRVWTQAELFMATCVYQKKLRGRPMQVYSADLDGKYDMVAQPQDITKGLHAQFHEVREWSLPPQENLGNLQDIKALEPMIMILSDDSVPQVVKAAMYRLPVALAGLMSENADVNASMPVSGDTPLHFAAGRQDYNMLRMLLAAPDIDVNAQNSMGRNAFHALVSFPYYTAFTFDNENQARCAELLLKKKCDPLVKDSTGKDAVQIHAMRNLGLNIFGDAQVKYLEEEQQREAELWLHTQGGVAIEYKSRNLPNGNVIAWREVQPVDGPASDFMICAPTALCSSLFFLEFATRVVLDAKFRVVILDLPGTGKSVIRAGLQGPPSIDHLFQAMGRLRAHETSEGYVGEYVKDLMAVFEMEGWTRGAHFVANNMGALPLTYIALQRPSWVKTLSLLGWKCSFRWPGELTGALEGMIKNLSACSEEEHMKALIPFGKPNMTEEMKNLFKRTTFSEREDATRMNVLTLFMSINYKNRLEFENLTMPILLAPGELDTTFHEHAYVFSQLMPQAKTIFVKGGGHYGPLENPGETSSVVLSFISSAKVAGSSS